MVSIGAGKRRNRQRSNSPGEFAPYCPAYASTLAKRGLQEIEEMAPAAACYAAPPGARGLGGVSQVYIKVFRTDGR